MTDISRRTLLQNGALLGAASHAAGQGSGIEVALRARDRTGAPNTTSRPIDPRRTAVFLVDAWHYHWCRTWRNRAGSLVPRINQSLDGARKLGMTLVFSPTNAMRDLTKPPQRAEHAGAQESPLPKLADLADPYPVRHSLGHV